MDEFRRAVWDVANRYRPLTLRQLYYRSVVARLVDKDESGSRANETRITKAVGFMRERYVDYYYDHDGGELDDAIVAAMADEYVRLGITDPTDEQSDASALAAYRKLLIMPFHWVADNTRTRYQARQYADKEEAVKQMHRMYRRDLWLAQPCHVEVWCESDALADVLMEVTDKYRLALLPCRGQAGKRFVFDSARSYRTIDKPVVVLYIGDFDPSGLDIRRSLHHRMIRYGAPDVDFRWLAVTPEQVRDQGLIGHGLNRNIPQPVLARFYAECDRAGVSREAVEAEAMEPAVLRDLLDDEINSLMDQRQWQIEQAVETSERLSLAAMLSGGAQ
jgi:hypothetical protein